MALLFASLSDVNEQKRERKGRRIHCVSFVMRHTARNRHPARSVNHRKSVKRFSHIVLLPFVDPSIGLKLKRAVREEKQEKKWKKFVLRQKREREWKQGNNFCFWMRSFIGKKAEPQQKPHGIFGAWNSIQRNEIARRGTKCCNSRRSKPFFRLRICLWIKHRSWGVD